MGGVPPDGRQWSRSAPDASPRAAAQARVQEVLTAWQVARDADRARRLARSIFHLSHNKMCLTVTCHSRQLDYRARESAQDRHACHMAFVAETAPRRLSERLKRSEGLVGSARRDASMPLGETIQLALNPRTMTSISRICRVLNAGSEAQDQLRSFSKCLIYGFCR